MLPNRCWFCKHWLYFYVCANHESRFYGNECSSLFCCEKFEPQEVNEDD